MTVSLDRLRNQRLCAAPFKAPGEVVSWLVAVQAQEYPDAKWALGLRMRSAGDAIVERAIDAGKILRTHVMRPTWHFVTPEDIRWLLALTGSRVAQAMSSYNRKMELDAATFRRSERAIVGALRGGAHLTRQELKAALVRAGIRADSPQRLAHLVMQAEIDAVVCSGPRRGTQFTYALLDERVPSTVSRVFSRDEALRELTRRYFTSHGPAQLHDFVWWSGLSVGDARAGVAMAGRDLTSEAAGDRTYWSGPAVRSHAPSPPALLLGAYDEYLIAYKDRSAAIDPSRWTRTYPRDPFSAPVVVGGQVAASWRKALRGETLVITLTPLRRLSTREQSAVRNAAADYARFFGRRVDVVWQ